MSRIPSRSRREMIGVLLATLGCAKADQPAASDRLKTAMGYLAHELTEASDLTRMQMAAIIMGLSVVVASCPRHQSELGDIMQSMQSIVLKIGK
jgi:hypothetical protein